MANRNSGFILPTHLPIGEAQRLASRQMSLRLHFGHQCTQALPERYEFYAFTVGASRLKHGRSASVTKVDPAFLRPGVR